ncbi:MAG TPA: T9SS type A sorting domain-containing protein [bacterium]|nr:T9SS type A sorting domain-containing protein [bacterium]
MKNRNGSLCSAQAAAPALVLLLCLLIPGSAALSQPFPSFMLDTTRALIPGFHDVMGTHVAFGPDVGLVVWDAEGTRAVRLNGNGELVDSSQIAIGGYGSPAVAWGEHNFLVAWAETNVVGCALVDSDGRITARAVLQNGHPQGLKAAVGFDGTNFLVTWIAYPDTFGKTAFFCRVSQQGVVLDSPPRLVAPLQHGRQADIALCFHQDRYLAVWNDWYTIGVSGNFVFPDGTIDDSTGFPIRHGVSASSPSVTHDRNNFIVAWNDSGNDIRGSRVTDSGVVLDDGGVLIGTYAHGGTSAASNGDTTLFLFRRDSVWDLDSLTLVGVRMDAAMNRLDSVPVKISAAGYDGWGDAPGDPTAAPCGNGYFVIWAQRLIRGENSEDNRQALARRVGIDGSLEDSVPRILSYSASIQNCGDLASDGANFLATWLEQSRDSTWARKFSLCASRFNIEGALLDAYPICVAGPKEHAPYAWPAVAFGGGCYMVTWVDSAATWARRISPAGVLLDSEPLRMPDSGKTLDPPDVAFGDSSFLVVWAESGSTKGIRGCRITPAGAILDSASLQLMVRQVGQPVRPRVAFDGANFLVARCDGDIVYRCARARTNGTLLDTSDITIGHGGSTPELAFGSGVYLVVDDDNSKCWRVSPSGTLLDSVSHKYFGGQAHVGFDGTDFTLLLCRADSGGLYQLCEARITPAGRLLDSFPFRLVTSDTGSSVWSGGMLSANGGGGAGIAFACDEAAPYLAERMRAAAIPDVVGVLSHHYAATPVAFRVQPNPASRMVSLSFNLTQAGPVRISAFDVAGRKYASLFSGRMKTGNQTLSLDTRRLANGVYFLRLEAGATTHSTRLVVAR